ncbi:MAG: ABC transporter ATP-binding protein, partial [Clostridiaceae bacterium]
HMTVVIITHNGALVDMADRVIRMKSGKVLEHYINESPKPVDEIEW